MNITKLWPLKSSFKYNFKDKLPQQYATQVEQNLYVLYSTSMTVHE